VLCVFLLTDVLIEPHDEAGQVSVSSRRATDFWHEVLRFY
jgi:hypothetical protein